jgi:hypothetical protein
MPRNIGTGVSSGILGSLDFVDNEIVTAIQDENLILDPDGVGTLTTDAPLSITDTTASNAYTNGSLVVTGGVGVAGDVSVTGQVVATTLGNIPIGATTPSTGAFTDLSVTGTAQINSLSDIIGTKSGATGTVTHDFQESNVWYHTGIAANFTANFTNVPTTNNKIYSIVLILVQGASPRYASSVQINGISEEINWAGYQLPSPQASRFEIQNIQLIRNNSVWTVFSSLSSYG